MLLPVPPFCGELDFSHFVDTVVLDDVRLAVEPDHIIVFVVPGQRPRADAVAFSIAAELLFERPALLRKVDRPLEVAEADFYASRDCRMDLVDVVVDAFVHRLDTVGDKHLPLEQPRLVHAREAFHLFDQLGGFFVGDEFGGLHRVDQQLELGQLEGPVRDEVFVPRALDVQPVNAQHFEVVVDALALRRDAVTAERVEDLRQREPVLVVGAFEQDLHEIEQLQLLIRIFRHFPAPFTVPL